MVVLIAGVCGRCVALVGWCGTFLWFTGLVAIDLRDFRWILGWISCSDGLMRISLVGACVVNVVSSCRFGAFGVLFCLAVFGGFDLVGLIWWVVGLVWWVVGVDLTVVASFVWGWYNITF